jgi:hypothetical protein
MEGEIPRYRTTPKGTDALWHFRELEGLIEEMRGEVGAMP